MTVQSQTLFPGQQADERVLYFVSSHPSKRHFGFMQALLYAGGLFLLVYLVAATRPLYSTEIRVGGAIMSSLLLVLLLWWNEVSYEKAKTVITDRRIIRFEASFPFFLSKRSFFWDDVTKLKGFAPNIFFRLMHVGTICVQPKIAPIEAIEIPYVYLYEDLTNYIDKLLYVQKNNPKDLDQLRNFVPKPAGQRDPVEEHAAKIKAEVK